MSSDNTSDDGELFIDVGVTLLSVALTLSLFAIHVVRKYQIKFIPESTVASIVGMLLGLMIRVSGQASNLNSLVSFNETAFFVFLLPPIIFDSGYGMDRPVFWRNLGGVILYAFIGTAVSAFAIGLPLYYLGEWGVSTSFTMLEAMAFGSLISATDPVSVLATFKDIKVNADLNALVFGESVFNDATGMVLYLTVISLRSTQLTGGSICMAVLQFCWIFVLSCLIGFAFGVLSALYFRYCRLDSGNEAYIEVGLLMLFPWLSYLVCQAANLSGICAILFCGSLMAMYVHPNLSATAKTLSQQLFNMLAMMTELLVFVYMGIALFTFDHPWKHVTGSLLAWVLLIVHVARALNVYPITWAMNYFQKARPFGPKFQFALWFSGLRGAMALALSVKALSDFDPDQGGKGDVIMSVTLFYVLFSVLFLGCTMQPVMARIGITQEAEGNVVDNYDPMQDPSHQKWWENLKIVLLRFHKRLLQIVIRPEHLQLEHEMTASGRAQVHDVREDGENLLAA